MQGMQGIRGEDFRLRTFEFRLGLMPVRDAFARRASL